MRNIVIDRPGYKFIDRGNGYFELEIATGDEYGTTVELPLSQEDLHQLKADIESLILESSVDSEYILAEEQERLIGQLEQP